MDDPELEEGCKLLERMWYGIAIQIVDLAVQVYGLSPAQKDALKSVFLKPNDYYVVLEER
jgi:hypothetical protein